MWLLFRLLGYLYFFTSVPGPDYWSGLCSWVYTVSQSQKKIFFSEEKCEFSFFEIFERLRWKEINVRSQTIRIRSKSLKNHVFLGEWWNLVKFWFFENLGQHFCLILRFLVILGHILIKIEKENYQNRGRFLERKVWKLSKNLQNSTGLTHKWKKFQENRF